MAEKTKVMSAAMVAGAVALAVSTTAEVTPAAAQAKEKCYGISLAGQNGRTSNGARQGSAVPCGTASAPAS